MLDDVSVLTTGSAASRRPKRPWTPVQTLASVDSRPASTRSDRSITSVSLNESFRRRKHRYPPYKPVTFGCARRFPPDEQRIAPIGAPLQPHESAARILEEATSALAQPTAAMLWSMAAGGYFGIECASSAQQPWRSSTRTARTRAASHRPPCTSSA